jgi:hypothetical protein
LVVFINCPFSFLLRLSFIDSNTSTKSSSEKFLMFLLRMLR